MAQLNGQTQQGSAPLLDLAQTILASASALTVYNLEQQNSSKASNKGPPPQAIIDASANLIQAASDITRVAAGPSNYLKSFSYAVSAGLR